MNSAKKDLVGTFQDFGGVSLRDVWVFDRKEYEPLYVGVDVVELIQDLDVSKYIETERHGYKEHEIYDTLHYADYEYTVRGFDSFEQFRMFLHREEDDDIGLFASFDVRNGGYNFHELYDGVVEVTEEHPVNMFRPNAESDRTRVV
ncbi:MAG: hypothetical protein SV377_04140 [Halobacteria archaeon]|nr:hypothetical protein [Halobacteria archaeon]